MQSFLIVTGFHAFVKTLLMDYLVGSNILARKDPSKVIGARSRVRLRLLPPVFYFFVTLASVKLQVCGPFLILIFGGAGRLLHYNRAAGPKQLGRTVQARRLFHDARRPSGSAAGVSRNLPIAFVEGCEN